MPTSIIPYLQANLTTHPSMTPQDIAKLCYQAAHGAEHLLSDLDRARRYLEHELESTEADGNLPLTEPISDAVSRVNLAPWKARELSAETLFDLFAATARVSGAGDDRLVAYLKEVSAYLSANQTHIPSDEWQSFLAWYNSQGRPAVHHSEAYRMAEKPAYRIVLRELLREIHLDGEI